MAERYRGTASYEGFEPNVYKDSKGIDTIGYGERWYPGMPTTMTKEEGKQRFDKKFAEHNASFYKKNPELAGAPENVKQALGDIAYNMGPDFLKKFPKMKAALVAGDYNTAASELVTGKDGASGYAKDVGDRAYANAALIGTPSISRQAVAPQAPISEPVNNLASTEAIAIADASEAVKRQQAMDSIMLNTGLPGGMSPNPTLAFGNNIGLRQLAPSQLGLGNIK